MDEHTEQIRELTGDLRLIEERLEKHAKQIWVESNKGTLARRVKTLEERINLLCKALKIDEPLPTFEDVRGILAEDPVSDANGWCHDLDKAPVEGYVLVARRDFRSVVAGFRGTDGQWRAAEVAYMNPRLQAVIAWRPLPDPPEGES